MGSIYNFTILFNIIKIQSNIRKKDVKNKIYLISSQNILCSQSRNSHKFLGLSDSVCTKLVIKSDHFSSLPSNILIILLSCSNSNVD